MEKAESLPLEKRNENRMTTMTITLSPTLHPLEALGTQPQNVYCLDPEAGVALGDQSSPVQPVPAPARPPWPQPPPPAFHPPPPPPPPAFSTLPLPAPLSSTSTPQKTAASSGASSFPAHLLRPAPAWRYSSPGAAPRDTLHIVPLKGHFAGRCPPKVPGQPGLPQAAPHSPWGLVAAGAGVTGTVDRPGPGQPLFSEAPPGGYRARAPNPGYAQSAHLRREPALPCPRRLF
ncbi:WAS/WASL-interacting protein family member 3-like [Elephas maximus indicus]|uniref:WAS/WASL-interacting protein family member 3-like n=1 Tax=Elephas maximus indicus TaxID=99487 RepID=UPI002116D154|nr:WAS/WASL-interacting protein family member 3-like [Elephas maximus indicus]